MLKKAEQDYARLLDKKLGAEHNTQHQVCLQSEDLAIRKVLPFIYYSAASSSVSSGISALRGAMTLTTGASI